MCRNYNNYCVLFIFLLAVFSDSAAEEIFQLIGFRGNNLVEIMPSSKERTLHVFDYPLAVDGATTIDHERVIFSSNNEMYLFNRITGKKKKLGSGRYPTYNKSTNTLYYFSTLFADGAWKRHLTKAELVNYELTKTVGLSANKENQSGGHIFVRSDNEIIFQAGGSEVFEWDEKAAKLTTLPIRDCNLVLLRSKANSLVCKSWGSHEYREVALLDFTEKPLKDVKAYLQEYIPGRDLALGFIAHFSIFKGEYFNLVIYNFSNNSSVEYKNLSSVENVVWSN